MRLNFPSTKGGELRPTSTPDELMKAILGYDPEVRAGLLQALLSAEQEGMPQDKIIEGGCIGPFKGWQVCGTVSSGGASVSGCVGGKQADVGERIARAFGVSKGWSVCVGGGKCLDLDLIDVANRAAEFGYRPILALDESKSTLGFVPFGSKGQLVADPYEAFKGIFGPAIGKGVGVSISIDL